MKLSILAAAILASTVSASSFAAAHAKSTLAMSGMVRAEYNNGNNDLLTDKLELNLDASAESNGLTYFAHAQLEGASAGSAGIDDARVGVKGGFGSLTIGDGDNACNATKVGGYSDVINDVNVGCLDASNNITYVGSAGSVAYAASYNPNEGVEHFSVGANAKFGPATVSLGHAAGDGLADTTLLGLAADFGAVGVGVRVQDADGSDTKWSAGAKYSAGANTFALGTNDDSKIIGRYTRDLGGKTAFTAEIVDVDGADTFGSLRMQHSF